MKLFSGKCNAPLAEKVAKHMGLSLSPLEIHIFPDGEKRVRVEEPVVDAQCAIIQTACTPTDQSFMELFFIADALKRSGASSVTAVIPYLGYQRQDHVFREGEAVSLEVIIKFIKAVGINSVVAFDLHSIKIPEVFVEFGLDVQHESALPLFAKEIKKQQWTAKDTVLVSPDKGGIRRIKQLSEMVDTMSYASIVKNRDLTTGEVSAEEIDGALNDRAIIVDDMISSGGTIAAAANLLLGKGVKEIIICATHAVLSDSAPQILQKSAASTVYLTDTVSIPEEKHFPKLTILSISQTIAHALKK